MHSWLALAKSDVASLGFDVIDSEGAYATPYSFFDTLQKHNPDVVIADGHGSPDTLTGQGLQEVLRACFNNEVLSGKVMCAVSCLTGQTLGPDSRKKTAQAYLGFVNEFSWVVSPPYDALNDPVAYSFQQIIRKMVSAACQYRQQLISLKQAYDGILAEFQKWEAYYSVPPGSQDEYASDILLSLRHDKTGLITLGEAERYIQAPTLLEIIKPLAPIALGTILTIATAVF